MNFATVLSLSSGILLFNLPKQSVAGVDPYQRAAVFFVLYLTSIEISSLGSGEGLRRIVQDEQTLHFYADEGQDLLVVLSTSLLFSEPIAERITAGDHHSIQFFVIMFNYALLSFAIANRSSCHYICKRYVDVFVATSEHDKGGRDGGPESLARCSYRHDESTRNRSLDKYE